MQSVFVGLAAVLGLAAAGGWIAKLLKQPALLGYIAAGVVLSGWGVVDRYHTRELVEILSQLGVTLLLFLVGLELPIAEMKRIGRVALLAGITQIIFSSVVGFFIVTALGFQMTTAFYLAIAFSFSSTIIVVKLLTEKKDLQSLYGKIAVGILLVQDFVAIGVLIVLSSFVAGDIEFVSLGATIGKGVVLIAVAMFLAGKVLPRVLHWVASSTETLFVTALAWCLVVSAVVASPWVGFSLEIGGFLAGVALANVVEHLQIVSRIRPLRDFFLTLFFVFLGANLNLGSLSTILLPAVVLTGFVLIAKPLIVMITMGGLGHKKRTSFLTSVTIAHISEFSLIVVALAYRIGHVDAEVLGLTALVSIMTMTISSYLITHSDTIFEKMAKHLAIFERKNASRPELTVATLVDHTVLIGHNRLGSVVRPTLEKLSNNLVVVDFNPETVAQLSTQGVKVIYGDLADSELYEDLKLTEAKLIVSTVSDKNDNLQLLEIFTKNKRPKIIVTAENNDDASVLYAAGADYVLVPRLVGGEYLSHLLTESGKLWPKRPHTNQAK